MLFLFMYTLIKFILFIPSFPVEKVCMHIFLLDLRFFLTLNNTHFHVLAVSDCQNILLIQLNYYIRYSNTLV